MRISDQLQQLLYRGIAGNQKLIFPQNGGLKESA